MTVDYRNMETELIYLRSIYTNIINEYEYRKGFGGVVELMTKKRDALDVVLEDVRDMIHAIYEIRKAS